MACEGPATILGGLPVIAEVEFTRGDGWTTDDDAAVIGLYWQKRDGSKGKGIPEHIWNRAEKYDYGLCNVIDQVTDYITYNQEQKEKTNGGNEEFQLEPIPGILTKTSDEKSPDRG